MHRKFSTCFCQPWCFSCIFRLGGLGNFCDLSVIDFSHCSLYYSSCSALHAISRKRHLIGLIESTEAFACAITDFCGWQGSIWFILPYLCKPQVSYVSLFSGRFFFLAKAWHAYSLVIAIWWQYLLPNNGPNARVIAQQCFPLRQLCTTEWIET